MTAFGRARPSARKAFDADLERPGLSRRRILATAALLLDAGYFRIGSPVYAERHGSIGLTTLRRRHVRREGSDWVFRFVAKSGLRRIERISGPQLASAIGALMRRRVGPAELFVYRHGSTVRSLSADELNGYLKDALGDLYSAKDFRTWHGTVLAAAAFALVDLANPSPSHSSATATARITKGVIADVSERLGNTPAVCRRSYIDPRVIDAFESSRTIATTVRRYRRPTSDEPDQLTALSRNPAIERAVLRLLRE